MPIDKVPSKLRRVLLAVLCAHLEANELRHRLLQEPHHIVKHDVTRVAEEDTAADAAVLLYAHVKDAGRANQEAKIRRNSWFPKTRLSNFCESPNTTPKEIFLRTSLTLSQRDLSLHGCNNSGGLCVQGWNEAAVKCGVVKLCIESGAGANLAVQGNTMIGVCSLSNGDARNKFEF